MKITIEIAMKIQIKTKLEMKHLINLIKNPQWKALAT